MGNCESVLFSLLSVWWCTLGLWEMLPAQSCASLHFLSTLQGLISAETSLMANSSTPHTSLFTGSLSDINKTLIRRILFSEAVFCLQFSVCSFLPTELPFLRTDRLEALAIYLFYSCLCTSVRALTFLWLCIRFLGITRGGKQTN